MELKDYPESFKDREAFKDIGKNPFRRMASDVMDEIEDLIIKNEGRQDIFTKNYYEYMDELTSILFDGRAKNDNEWLKTNSRLLNYIISIAEDCEVDKSVILKELKM